MAKWLAIEKMAEGQKVSKRITKSMGGDEEFWPSLLKN